MRETYSSLQNAFLDRTQNTGSTDSNLLSFFQREMNNRYQVMLTKMDNYTTQIVKTATTVSDQQFYHNPAGIVNIENATITVNSIAYPLEVIQSQENWDRLNEVLISTTSIPQFIFPRRDDFGIWPIPQDAYTITFNHHWRDRDLTIDDYTTGTITVTNNSQTIEGSGTTFTALMVGRWLRTDQSGLWYRVSGFTDTDTIILESSYEGSSGSSLAFVIGESPELPEEGHILLADGAAADWWAGQRGNIERANYFNNVFWTGDGSNFRRSGLEVKNGLVGMVKRYSSRSNTRLVRRKPISRRISTLWGSNIV